MKRLGRIVVHLTVLVALLVPVIVFAGPASACTGGCTPGYWKQPHHFDSWFGYSPDDLVTDVFGAGPAGITLLGGLKAKGGGENALLRHAVASLLNAAYAAEFGVFDFWTEWQVKQMYISGLAGDWESVKDQFEEANELGCPLD